MPLLSPTHSVAEEVPVNSSGAILCRTLYQRQIPSPVELPVVLLSAPPALRILSPQRRLQRPPSCCLGGTRGPSFFRAMVSLRTSNCKSAPSIPWTWQLCGFI
ncbi:hypothetical protein WOLCODRAFT_139456 [Wolfiporia cocos MD-104 SS10]|uniref:Uncharacterized protein n=1 Tax=Wolfiporia cocos (strain MD-104) TaxID=742152 RepID=A0A2H3IXA1_WOLCO|nr:hypothetical protein WOLCODRAFT_139456 [Wolfiporia cocos MD-104 SS10]